MDSDIASLLTRDTTASQHLSEIVRVLSEEPKEPGCSSPGSECASESCMRVFSRLSSLLPKGAAIVVFGRMVFVAAYSGRMTQRVAAIQQEALGHPDRAFLAGTLPTLGRFLMLHQWPTGYAQLCASQQQLLFPDDEHEQHTYGISHSKAARLLSQKHDLPGLDDSYLQRVVRYADCMAVGCLSGEMKCAAERYGAGPPVEESQITAVKNEARSYASQALGEWEISKKHL